jgi:hypothetical protein
MYLINFNENLAAASGVICDDNAGSSVSIAEVSSPFYRKIVAQAIGLGLVVFRDLISI